MSRLAVEPHHVILEALAGERDANTEQGSDPDGASDGDEK